ncbi:hypothetical protein [Polyangium aurulentum]|uniref:hypothetical protein n=1 Tax=Polyangium aurulentum TaxID=2567896 RepID=UPI0010AE5209|nr:hypothetical protein [Polyangium aurulentum]UQA59368.1 hypothetical protein E8A73_002325 [Polyangium aurulentum]
MRRWETWLRARSGVGSMLLAAALSAGCGRGAEPARKESTLVTNTPPPRADVPATPPPADGARVLVREEVVPGKLWVTVYAHALATPGGSMQLWTYASEGLWPLGQREIRFSVKREPGEGEGAFDRQLFDVYKLVYDLAREKRFVSVHGYSQLGGPPLLGRDDFHCIVYAPPQPVEGLPSDAPFLTAVIVTCEEEQLAARTGYARLFARLGASARFYPTPFWTDRKRAVETRPGDFEKSLLTKAPVAHLAGVSVRLERKGGLANTSKTDGFFVPGDRVVLRVLPHGAAELKEAAAAKVSEDAMLMLLEMDPTAGTSLVWYPGQPGANVIVCPTAGGDRITGNFLFMTDKSKPLATASEDGFGLFFPEATWKRIREALIAGKPITIPGQGDMPEFVVEHVSTTYVSPVDGKRYESEAGWTEARPSGEGGAAKRYGQVEPSVVLLTSQHEMAQRTTAEDAAGVMKAIIAAVEAQVGTSKGPGSDLVIECELLPGNRKTFQIAQRPTADRPFAQAVHEKLEKIAVPEVKGPVKFQVVFKIRGGSKPAAP